MKGNNQAKRRIKLRFDYDRAERIERNVNGYVEFANTQVVPLLQKLGFATTKENIIRYAGSSDLLKSDYIKNEKGRANVGNEYIEGMVERDAESRFDEAFNECPYDDQNPQYPEMIAISKNKLVVDDDAIREAATIYVEGEKQLEAYDRHQAAVKALNEFFNGKAPEGFGALESYFPVVEGVVKAGTTCVNYQSFIIP